MKIKKNDLLELVNKKLNISDEFDIQLTQEKETIYVYSEKVLDSMMLVVLISEIEEELLLEYI